LNFGTLRTVKRFGYLENGSFSVELNWRVSS